MNNIYRNLLKSTFTIALAASGVALPAASFAGAASSPKPTIVLVHGAFAESSSWDGVSAKLIADGYKVVGAANPLRSVKSDAAYISGIVKNIPGPVILVGHSYGGSVISTAANGNQNVKGLVYVAAFAPDTGETAIGLSSKYPGSTLGSALAQPVTLDDGGKDLYINQSKFRDQFAADVPAGKAKLMAAAQRPITEAAIVEASGEPAWKNIPSWFVYGKADKNIPEATLDFMAKRANSQKTVAIKGASHVVMTSHPVEVSQLIETAAKDAIKNTK